MKAKNGYFVVSLDFELFWGIRDKFSFEEYGPNVLGVWDIFPKLLDTFEHYNIHATFATVGAMFAKDLNDLKQFIPKVKPDYQEKILSPYHGYIEDSVNHDPQYYFGNELIQLLKKYPNQEIGTHTFSHYYALEDGQNLESFLSDLNSAIEIAKTNGIEINSFVFPRHQLNPSYIQHFPKLGIQIYRGTEEAWYHSPARGKDEGIVKRAVRYADYYIYLGSNHLQDISTIKQGDLYCIRASRWLRPFDKRKLFQKLKVRRIKQQMKAAAKSNKIFHLWWHPHEFGVNQKENFMMLEEILNYYEKLNQKYNFQSMNFRELVAHKNEIDG